MVLSNTLSIMFTHIARAGGGGSSKGGSGSGVFFLGYIIMFSIGNVVKKILPRTAELIVGGIIGALISILVLVLGIMGHTFGSTIFAIVFIAGIWTGWASSFYGVWERITKKSKITAQQIDAASQSDTSWNRVNLENHCKNVFMKFQADWSTFNVNSMQTYLTASCFSHNRLLLQAIYQLGRTNSMSNVVIEKCMIFEMHDDQDNSKDSFTVAFEAKANDQLINKQGTVLYTDTKSFTEYWKFIKHENTWLLDIITQDTDNSTSYNATIQNFAVQNNMYYSSDMGWLLLPERGVLMGSGKFGSSDINNHVIGTYRGLLTQFYTYSSNVGNTNNATWLISQVTLPKSYGGILIQPKRNVFSKTFDKHRLRVPKNYTKHTFEWPDFNNRYEVYATDRDQLATFELVNPKFMEYLYDNSPDFGIEVAENTAYLYQAVDFDSSLISDTHYKKMLDIILQAYKELKI